MQRDIIANIFFNLDENCCENCCENCLENCRENYSETKYSCRETCRENNVCVVKDVVKTNVSLFLASSTGVLNFQSGHSLACPAEG